jgi:shikimate kinase
MSKDQQKRSPQEKASNTEIIQASAKGTAKIIQTPLGKSASYALDLETFASVQILEDTKDIKGKITPEIKKLSKDVLALLGCRNYGLSIKIEPKIPLKAGLGEDEAASVAVALAVAGSIAKKHGAVNELKIDKYVKEQFMVAGDRIVDKKKLLDLCPGEFDRVFTSFYGGFAVCDNRKKEILRRGEMETMQAVIAFPKKAEKTEKDRILLYRHETDIIWDEALKGNLYTAMRLNTLLYADTLAPKMLRAGAITAHTSYPSTIGLTRDEKKTKAIENSVKKEAKTFVVKVANNQAAALVKPRRIVKTKDFLAIKGGDDYFFL